MITENTVEKRGNKWCVVHGHPKKAGSKTDKPKGTVIKCFNTKKEADAMHRAIMANENEGLQFNALTHLITHMSSLISETVWEEEEYWVVPTILMVEGVHNGLFYGREELELSAPGWNGEPVVAWHPKEGGEPVTANDPETLTKYKVGQIFNARMEGTKLKGDAYINKKRANSVSPELVQMLCAGAPLEVSTGVYIREDKTPGEWEGEEFRASALDHKPDHLAFLPGGKGACSWEDGGGAPRINREDKDMSENSDKDPRPWWKKAMGFFHGNEPSHDELYGQLRSLVQAANPPQGGEEFPGVQVMEVFDKHLIFARWGNDGKDHLFKQNYSVGADESAELVGDAVEVRLRKEYVPVAAPPETQDANNPKEGGDTMERKDKVDALIADEKSRWGDESRDYLMGLEDEVFTTVTAEADPQEDPESLEDQLKAEEKEDDSDAVKAARKAFADTGKAPEPKDQEPEPEDSKKIEVKDLPPEVQRAVKREQDYMSDLVKELDENPRCKFSKEDLEKKGIDELETLAEMVDVKVSYEGRSTAPRDSEDEDAGVSEPVAINWEEMQGK